MLPAGPYLSGWLIYLEEQVSVGLGWCCWAAATQDRGADVSLSPAHSVSAGLSVAFLTVLDPAFLLGFVFHVQRGTELP